MSDDEKHILSLFLDSPSFLDRVVRKVRGDSTFVVEYKNPHYDGYGGSEQKRHQRRYRDFPTASRRFDYILATKPVEKAFILDYPLNVSEYTEKAKKAGAKCTRCGSHSWVFDVEETNRGRS